MFDDEYGLADKFCTFIQKSDVFITLGNTSVENKGDWHNHLQ